MPLDGPGGFWEQSPGQIVAVLRSQGLVRRKGGASDLLQMFGGQKGVRVNRHEDPQGEVT